MFWTAQDKPLWKVLSDFFAETNEDDSFKLNELVEAMDKKSLFLDGLIEDFNQDILIAVSNNVRKVPNAVFDALISKWRKKREDEPNIKRMPIAQKRKNERANRAAPMRKKRKEGGGAGGGGGDRHQRRRLLI